MDCRGPMRALDKVSPKALPILVGSSGDSKSGFLARSMQLGKRFGASVLRRALGFRCMIYLENVPGNDMDGG